MDVADGEDMGWGYLGVGVYGIIVTSSQNRLKPFVVLGLRV